MAGQTTRFSTIWNMSFGFLGIQFGWGLQMANMSAIYEYLGAKPDQIPMLWLAAPITGLLVQPVIGHLSARPWSPRLGRRRPFFLVGAILSSCALTAMPMSSGLWMAAGLLWILDASINISMEPFRAFVADLLPASERTRGFAMQSFFIGSGAVIASALPWMMTNWFGVAGSAPGTIPTTVRLSFFIGAAAFFGAVLYTIVTTGEKPPPDLAEFRRRTAATAGLAAGARDILAAIKAMPDTMRQLSLVQIATWLGLFCMWLYFPVAVATNVFGAPDASSPLYQRGVGRGLLRRLLGGLLRLRLLPAAAGEEARSQGHPRHLPPGGRGGASLGGGDLESPAAAALDGRRRHRVGQHALHALFDPGGLDPAGEDRDLHGDLQFLHRDSRDHRLARLRVGDVAPAAQQPDGRGDRGRGVPRPGGAAGDAGEGARGGDAAVAGCG